MRRQPVASHIGFAISAAASLLLSPAFAQNNSPPAQPSGKTQPAAGAQAATGGTAPGQSAPAAAGGAQAQGASGIPNLGSSVASPGRTSPQNGTSAPAYVLPQTNPNSSLSPNLSLSGVSLETAGADKQALTALTAVDLRAVDPAAYKLVDVRKVLKEEPARALGQRIRMTPAAMVAQQYLTSILQQAHRLQYDQTVVGILPSEKAILIATQP